MYYKATRFLWLLTLPVLLSACMPRTEFSGGNPNLVRSYRDSQGAYIGPGTLTYQQTLDIQRAVSKINRTRVF